MPWTGNAPNAGFSTADPWLPLNADWATRNVETEKSDRGSILWLYRDLLSLRRSTDALSIGDYREVEARGDLLMFDRRHGDHCVRIALNFGETAIDLSQSGQVLLSTLGKSGRPSTLRPNEGLIFLAGEPH
jgi:glycosidase